DLDSPAPSSAVPDSAVPDSAVPDSDLTVELEGRSLVCYVAENEA
ncbi:hypothetical protein LCGC14_2481880, partial [marine sediment metagenome]